LERATLDLMKREDDAASWAEARKETPPIGLN